MPTALRYWSCSLLPTLSVCISSWYPQAFCVFSRSRHLWECLSALEMHLHAFLCCPSRCRFGCRACILLVLSTPWPVYMSISVFNPSFQTGSFHYYLNYTDRHQWNKKSKSHRMAEVERDLRRSSDPTLVSEVKRCHWKTLAEQMPTSLCPRSNRHEGLYRVAQHFVFSFCSTLI